MKRVTTSDVIETVLVYIDVIVGKVCIVEDTILCYHSHTVSMLDQPTCRVCQIIPTKYG